MRLFALVASVLLGVMSVARGAPTEKISPATMGQWSIHATNTSSAEFVKEGPASPPAGSGSLRLATGDGDGKDKGGKVWVGISACDGLPLSGISTLTFTLFIEKATNPNVGPYINIHLDTNDNGKWDGRAGGDDILAFDPIGQPPPNGSLPMATGTWNTGPGGGTVHDAGPNTGGWWIVGKEKIAGRDGTEKTLAQIIEAIGDHKIIANANEGVPGLTFIAGAASGGSFTNFVGYIDRVTLGVKNYDTIYDFEWSLPPAPTPVAAKASGPAPAPADMPITEPDRAETSNKFARVAVIMVVGVMVIAAVALARRKR